MTPISWITAVTLYGVAVVAFILIWFAEQPSAIRIAWLHSFALAHERIERLHRKAPK